MNTNSLKNEDSDDAYEILAPTSLLEIRILKT